MSGKRGSNPRPSAWEADALPTELLPHRVPGTRLELARLAALAPETSASTIPPPGLSLCKGNHISPIIKIFAP